jgi:hypothetical protein
MLTPLSIVQLPGKTLSRLKHFNSGPVDNYPLYFVKVKVQFLCWYSQMRDQRCKKSCTNLTVGKYKSPIAVIGMGLLLSHPCLAGPFDSFSGRKYSEATSSRSVTTQNYKGRDLLVYAPPNVPALGARVLVIVLHGGLGNASRIEGGAPGKGLKVDEVAEKNGFIVAYLNGTPVTRTRKI